MRVSKERAAQNRQKILTAATRLFRERGIGATGVDAITEDAALTHGAVYSQFGSKEAIAAEAMREVMAGARRLWRRLLERNGRKQTLPAIVAGYLSRVHRDSAGKGCLVEFISSAATDCVARFVRWIRARVREINQRNTIVEEAKSAA